MTTGVEIGIALGVEVLKWAMSERALRQKMAAAGLSEAATDAALKQAREEVALLDPTKLPQV